MNPEKKIYGYSLTTPEEIRRALCLLANRVLRQEADVQVARAFGYLMGIVFQHYELIEVKKEIAELKKLVEMKNVNNPANKNLYGYELQKLMPDPIVDGKPINEKFNILFREDSN